MELLFRAPRIRSDRPRGMEMEQTPGELLGEFGRSVFVVDPRFQGFGLQKYGFLDAYANKFFILTNADGMFISPKVIPSQLHDYYEAIGVAVAPRDHVISLEDTGDGKSLIERSQADQQTRMLLERNQRRNIVPYMLTREVENFAERAGLVPLADAETTEKFADKARFREELDGVANDVRLETGFDVRVRSAIALAKERVSLEKEYISLSRKGKRRVVLIRPQSASALGIFVLPENQGIEKLRQLLNAHFLPDDEVMLSEYVEHQESPSMQGGRMGEESYGHFYFGRQLVSEEMGVVNYEGSQIPFGPQTVPGIKTSDVTRLREAHGMLGEYFLTRNNMQGIAGFDMLTHFSRRGSIDRVKITEMNLHLPSSLAVFAAMQKMFPEGFEGVAHNYNVSLPDGTTVDDFMKTNQELLVRERRMLGIFPLNVSYSDRVDIVLFGKDIEHISALQKAIKR